MSPGKTAPNANSVPSPERAFPAVRLRILVAEGIAIGPGKATLLAEIARSGSIAAAGRTMGMSYKRAWSLIEELNGLFATPVVATTRGGRSFGGAALTPLGEKVLAIYRQAFAASGAAIAGELDELDRLLRAPAGEPQKSPG